MSFHVYFNKQVHVYFNKQVHYKLKKKQKQKQIWILNFAESNTHQKTNARGSFETYNLFCLALFVSFSFCLEQHVLNKFVLQVLKFCK